MVARERCAVDGCGTMAALEWLTSAGLGIVAGLKSGAPTCVTAAPRAVSG